MRVVIAAFLFLTLLSACGDEATPYLQPISFPNQPPITLNVATIEVVDEYVPPERLPNVEHAAPTPPYKAVRIWANQRLHAAGTSGYVRVGIRDAHIVQKQLIGQIEYDGRLDVVIDAQSGDGERSANTEVTIERQVITDNDKDLQEKEKIWDDLTHQMMADFDKGMTAAINTNLGQFTGPNRNRN